MGDLLFQIALSFYPNVYRSLGHDLIFIQAREYSNGIIRLDEINYRLQTKTKNLFISIQGLHCIFVLLLDQHLIIEESLNFSLVKLIQSCSKELDSMISNSARSKTRMKLDLEEGLSML